MITRRTFSSTLAATAAGALAAPAVFADSNKPLRILVGFSAGGSSDVAASSATSSRTSSGCP